MTTRGIFTTFYGKKYRAVYSSRSRARANIMAHATGLILKEEMDIKEKLVILLEHRGTRHYVFVKQPFDKMIKNMR